MKFIDTAEVHVKAGDGGNGCMSFRHEKHMAKGGPDGGDGGDGGDVVFVADDSLNTLTDLNRRQLIKAKRADDGGTNKCFGADGPGIEVRLPLGSVIRDKETGLILRDFKVNDERVIVAHGGKGGRGNVHFASATNQVPQESEPGTPGEERDLEIELKLLADVALLGLPNAGKSTLITALSSAHPKIADYPFTTLNPTLGIVEIGDHRRLVMVDLPGLIEGAHDGVGLGDQFLRHMGRCKILCHVIDATGLNGHSPEEAFEVIENELKAHNSGELLDLPRVVALNKIDSIEDPDEMVRQLKDKIDLEVYGISAAGRQNLDVLKAALADILEPAS
jgi:GTP-binding protein